MKVIYGEILVLGTLEQKLNNGIILEYKGVKLTFFKFFLLSNFPGEMKSRI